MVTCKCGRVMEKVPNWLQGTSVDFVCNHCPDRKTKNIAFISLEPTAPAAAPAEAPDEEMENEDLGDDEES